MRDSNPIKLFSYVIESLSTRNIGYLHLIEPRSSLAGGEDGTVNDAPDARAIFRQAFKGVLISAGGYTGEEAIKAVQGGLVDAVAFGRLFISNPDLPKRLQLNSELNSYDRQTFYGGAEKGYTDYPAL
jgi:N-ethylmaleimide reductase